MFKSVPFKQKTNGKKGTELGDLMPRGGSAAKGRKKITKLQQAKRRRAGKVFVNRGPNPKLFSMAPEQIAERITKKFSSLRKNNPRLRVSVSWRIATEAILGKGFTKAWSNARAKAVIEQKQPPPRTEFIREWMKREGNYRL